MGLSGNNAPPDSRGLFFFMTACIAACIFMTSKTSSHPRIGSRIEPFFCHIDVSNFLTVNLLDRCVNFSYFPSYIPPSARFRLPRLIPSARAYAASLIPLVPSARHGLAQGVLTLGRGLDSRVGTRGALVPVVIA